MEYIDIIRYYSKPIVTEEIAKFCKSRWVALHTQHKTQQFIRYFNKEKKPLKINKPEDIRYLLFRFQGFKPRTFYGSVNLYRNLANQLELDNPENIFRSTPTWDIDGSLEHWRGITRIARIILDELDKHGVSKSVYLKWSGRGIHIHIHEGAFSEDVLSKHHPLDLAYAVVDYILRKVEEKVREVIKSTPPGDRPLKVENEMDLKRVFTTPLSLHKQLDMAAVCLKPDDLENFDLSWADPSNFRHNTDWDKYIDGETDDLALRAISEVGGYFERIGGIRTVIEVYKREVERVRRERTLSSRVGRFQVMALLQAARYYVLTGDLDKAKSFGLNRAIFYAWAKYHGRDRRLRGYSSSSRSVARTDRREFKLGNEVTFVSDRGWFIIGDKEQLPSDYDKEVVDKIRLLMPYEEAWKKAVEYIKSFPKDVLLDQQEFYSKVYEPVRDIFLKKKEFPRERLFPHFDHL